MKNLNSTTDLWLSNHYRQYHITICHFNMAYVCLIVTCADSSTTYSSYNNIIIFRIWAMVLVGCIQRRVTTLFFIRFYWLLYSADTFIAKVIYI